MRKPWVGLISFVATAALAHSVNIDGQTSDWSTRNGVVWAAPNVVAANVFNYGLVIRSDAGTGEYVYDDRVSDQRTDFANSGETDLTRVRVTGTPQGASFLIQLQGAPSAGPNPPQVQIALDLDRVNGSGNAAFVGNADTNVAQDARWEFLIQSQATSTPPARLVNTALATVANGVQAARNAGNTVLEFFVPWSALGLMGPPTTPIRISVATFREINPGGTTADIGGSAFSNALDVMTNNGDPTLAPVPNTLAEVTDLTVNYSADIWFDAQGEVYSPILITHVVSSGLTNNGGDYVVLTNVSPVTIPLSGWRITDAEKVKSAEGVYSLDPAASLAPGAHYVIVANASNYFAHFNRRPNAEFANSPPDDALTPNLVLFLLWNSGLDGGTVFLPFNLTNLGDEVLLYDDHDELMDVVTYGAGSTGFPGVVPKTPEPAPDHIMSRLVTTQDTDDCSVDFVDRGTTCTNTAGCGAASSCVACSTLNACEPVTPGTPCPDGNVCNGNETCDVFGTCAPGVSLTCVDGNICTNDTCNPTTGCQFPPQPVGTPCSDGNACNGLEVCNAMTVCDAGVPLNCNDQSICTTDSCAPASGCVFTPTNLGQSCTDNNVCNGLETCQSNGACLGMGALNCDDGNPCTADSCNAMTGCAHTQVMAGTACSDGNACNGLETCNMAGACVSGTAPTCVDSNPCTSDSCTPMTGCVFAPVMPGTSCSDGNVCNGLETCSMAGACVMSSSPLSCGDMNGCTIDSCDPMAGCLHATADAGTSCDDGNLCNGIETCNLAGACTAGTSPVCNDNNGCTRDSCVPASGCSYAPVDAGTLCSDGNACNGVEVCNAGTCQPGMTPSCDDFNPCTADSCNTATGCTHTAVMNGVSCSDSNVCNGLETCQAGACVVTAGTVLSCSDTNPCTINGCHPVNGCTVVNAMSGTSCSDGNACNGDETCNASGMCQPGVAPTVCDGGRPDSGVTDAGAPDAGPRDAGAPDAGVPDAGVRDAGVPDAGSPDAGRPDAGAPDAGAVDAGAPDAGVIDAGVADAGEPDAGATDAGEVDAGNEEDAGAMVVDSGIQTEGDAGFDADGGMRPDPKLLPPSCGCSSAGFFPALALLALMRRRRERKS